MNYEQLLLNALNAEGADERIGALVNSIFTQESSRGRNTRTSNQGAKGAMQMLDSTFKGYADKGWNIDNPEHNLRAGIRYLKDLDRQFKGDVRATAAAYYGGPKAGKALLEGRAYRDLKNPNAPDTLQYADKVASRIPGFMVDKEASVVAQGPVRSDNVVKVNNVPIQQPIAGVTKPLSDTSYSNALAQQLARYEEEKKAAQGPVRGYEPIGLGAGSAVSGVMGLPQPVKEERGTHPLWMDFMAPFMQSKSGFDWFKA